MRKKSKDKSISSIFFHDPDAPPVQIKYSVPDREREKIKLTYTFGGKIKVDVSIKKADGQNLWDYLQYLDNAGTKASEELRRDYFGMFHDLWTAIFIKHPAVYFRAAYSPEDGQRDNRYFNYTYLYLCAPRLNAFVKEELGKPPAERDRLIKKTLSLPEEETSWLRPTHKAVTTYLLRKVFPRLVGNKEDDYIIDQYVYKSRFNIKPAKDSSGPGGFKNSFWYPSLLEAIENLSK